MSNLDSENIKSLLTDLLNAVSKNVYLSIGLGDKIKCDFLATEAMRSALFRSNINAKIVLGEGEMDEAPMLYNGECFGNSVEKLDVVVDPLDGTNLAAKNKNGAIAIMLFANQDSIVHLPEVYCMKIASAKVPQDSNVLSLNYTFEQNLINLAHFLNKNVNDLSIIMLDRERHKIYIDKCIELGINLTLISDGDIIPVLETREKYDLYYGIGGSPEGILSAGIIKCLGGFMEIKIVENELYDLGSIQQKFQSDFNKIYNINSIFKSDVMIGVSFVTDGFKAGIRKNIHGKFIINSLILNSQSKIIENIETEC
jgi:fructose-1,6-bisphosphatase/sedoheptulose 1,7-bisphosphatase-like protein